MAARPSFARYAALVAGVLDASADAATQDGAGVGSQDGGTLDVGTLDVGSQDGGTLDVAARRAAGSLRRPVAAPPRGQPSPSALYREWSASPPSAAGDARLDRRG